MRILVTGATGFIGRPLCRALRGHGHDVQALVRPGADAEALTSLGVTAILGDVTAPASLPPALAGADAVVHLAGALHASRESTYDRVNREGTENLARACRGLPVRRFVYLSSLAAQGPSAPGRPHRHSGDERPINAYGRSKLAAEKALADEAAAGLPVTVLRPATVYGPGDPEIAFWARLARVLPVAYGLELSFLHVDDLVSLIVRVVERETAPPGPFFLSDGDVYRMEQVADLVERLVQGAPAFRVPLPPRLLDLASAAAARVSRIAGVGDVAARILQEMGASGWACASDDARDALGFTTARAMPEALPEVFEWYRAQGWL